MGAIFFNAFVSTIFGFGMMGYLIKSYSPNAVAPFGLLVPIFGLVAGYLLLGEMMNSATVMACMLIMLGLAYPRCAPGIRARLSRSFTALGGGTN